MLTQKFGLAHRCCILQTDGTYMFNLEGFIPKLCHLAEELGEDERAKHLRSAGLQALSSLVFFPLQSKLYLLTVIVAYWNHGTYHQL